MAKKAIPLPVQLHARMALHVMSIAPQWWTSGSFPSIYISLNQLRHFSKCVSRKSCATCVFNNTEFDKPARIGEKCNLGRASNCSLSPSRLLLHMYTLCDRWFWIFWIWFCSSFAFCECHDCVECKVLRLDRQVWKTHFTHPSHLPPLAMQFTPLAVNISKHCNVLGCKHYRMYAEMWSTTIAMSCDVCHDDNLERCDLWDDWRHTQSDAGPLEWSKGRRTCQLFPMVIIIIIIIIIIRMA